jgi:hypothetical protein
MTTAIKRRRGTTSQHSTFTGLEGELTIDTTKDTVVVHDGATAGGFPLAKESGSAIAATTLSASGAFSANGGVTLGDASGDALTINSSAVSIPNGLNFDSNTLVIDATNNRVGVGFANPSYPLEIALDSAVTGGGCTVLTSVAGGAYGFLGTVTNHALVFASNGTERMRITSAGNVGIGTSSPTAKIDARLSGTSSGTVINVGNTGTGEFGGLGISDGGAYPVELWGSSLSFKTGSSVYASATEKMRLDSSGNLGLGVTPSAWTLGKSISVGDVGSAVFGFGGYNSLTSGAYFNSGWKYSSSSSSQKPALFVGSDGGFSWSTAAAGTAGNAITFTQAMTLDASGNLGIGTTSPIAKLQVKAQADGNIAVQPSSFVAGGVKLNVFNDAGSANTALDISAQSIQFATAGTERMRIDSSGNLLVGTTTASTKVTVNLSGANDGITLRTTNEGAIGLLGMVNPGSNNDIQIGTLGNNNLRFFTNGTANERMRIDSSGNLLVGITSARANAGDVQVSKGISFPATQSAQSDGNTLDDYEEGTWTPTDASGAGLTFSEASGFYTKIGRSVVVLGRVVYPSTANTSACSVGGLPFAVPNNTIYRSGANGYNNNGLSLYPIATINTSNCTFILHATGGSATNAQCTAMTINFTITYFV